MNDEQWAVYFACRYAMSAMPVRLRSHWIDETYGYRVEASLDPRVEGSVAMRAWREQGYFNLIDSRFFKRELAYNPTALEIAAHMFASNWATMHPRWRWWKVHDGHPNSYSWDYRQIADSRTYARTNVLLRNTKE